MATFNMGDLTTMIRSFMVNEVKTAFPLLDTSENSTFDDLSIKPFISAAMPLVDIATRSDLVAVMSDPESLEKSDVDAWGMSNYLIARNPGSKAVSTVTLSFSKVPTADTTTIPPGTIFSTSSGLSFFADNILQLTPSEFESKYNSQKLTYDIDIPVTAEIEGTVYNVSENQITLLGSEFTSSNLVSTITNKVPASGGVDYETNTEYVDRLKDYYINRYPNTRAGYSRDIVDNFPEISSSLIVGYKDPNMERDVIGGVHIGGKVDIYVVGSLYQTITTSITMYTGKIKVSGKAADITDVSLINLTEPSRTVSFTTETVGEELFVTIVNTGETSYDPDKRNDIRISYSELNIAKTQYAIVGGMKYELNSPAIAILSAKNPNSETEIPQDKYQIHHELNDGSAIPLGSIYLGSNQEVSSITFDEDVGELNGDSVDVTYTYNLSVKNIGEFYEPEQRVITVDVLIKNADQVPVNIKLKAHPKTGFSIGSEGSASIINTISAFFKNLDISEDIKNSDIIGALYADETVSSWLGYVDVPFDAFYIPTDIDAPIEDIVSGSILAINDTNVGYLNKISVVINPTT